MKFATSSASISFSRLYPYLPLHLKANSISSPPSSEPARVFYYEAIDILYEHNFFAIHLQSPLHTVAYEPFLSNLAKDNAAKIKELEIVLWGNDNEDDSDAVSFGTENFGIALHNLMYAPKW